MSDLNQTNPVNPETIQLIEKFPEYLEAFNTLKSKLKGLKITSGTLINIVRYAMEIVELTKVKGTEQKRMVIELLRDLFDGDENDLPIPEEEKALCLQLINNGSVSETIDIIVDATKGRININQITKVTTKCCFAFFK